jgi:sterol desaturase/sphingolipid hydroxylase (fatty acid hydroxylase superfamily)
MDIRLLSSIIIVGSALLIIVVERHFPYVRQGLFRAGMWTDLFWYSIVQSWVLGIAISALIRTIDASTGLSRLHLVSGWPILGQLAFFFVLHDLYIYWFHRLQHANPLLWRLHEAHHSVRDVDWVAGSRSHAFEILINQTIEFAPIILLGGAPSLPIIKAIIDSVWGMWIHANVRVRTGKLQYLINGPEMHRWHHALDVAPPGKNFATKLAIWDWMFKTAYLPAHKPAGYGLGARDFFPQNYFLQLLWAFRLRDGRRLAEAFRWPFGKRLERRSAS